MKNPKVKIIIVFLFISLFFQSPSLSYASNTLRSETILQRTPTSAIIEVNYIGIWDPAAQEAVEYAASIWETLINSPVPITIDALWLHDVLFEMLAYGAPALSSTGCTGSPFSYASYPDAICDAWRGSDNDSEAEINITFNADIPNWYFGIDGNPPDTHYDLVTIALQQIAPGLGFHPTFRYRCTGQTSTTGCYGPDGYWFPDIFDLFVANGTGQSLTDLNLFPNPSEALGTQLLSNDLYFTGIRAVAVNGGIPPKLYAPSNWANITHPLYLDESSYPPGNPNSLMTPIIAPGEAFHHPGPVALAILQDLWVPNMPPLVGGLPTQLLLVNTMRDNAIDVWDYTTDETPDEELIVYIPISNPPDPNAGVTVDGYRYIDINPTPGWTGQTAVQVIIQDSGGLYNIASFNVVVAPQIYTTYLPIALKN